MVQTQATLPGGARLFDYMSVNVVSRFYLREVVCSVLSSGRQKSRRCRDLPMEVMVYYVIVMALFRSVSTREVLRWTCAVFRCGAVPPRPVPTCCGGLREIRPWRMESEVEVSCGLGAFLQKLQQRIGINDHGI